MPIGLIVMKWDERVGANVMVKYPEDISIEDKTLMQIYSTHEYTGEAGLISLNIGALNIASYYAGSETGLYVILLLNIDEDPDVFEDGLSDTARQILLNMEEKAYEPLIPSLFQRLSVYPSLNAERKLAMIYSDDAKRAILKRLQKEGTLLKSEISVWLRDQFSGGFVDAEGLIQSLIKQNIVKSLSVEASPSDVIYLINDIYLTRAPPATLINDAPNRGLPAELHESYKGEVKNFFNDYIVSEDDNIALMNLLLDPPVYETLTLLRQAIVTKDDLEKLQKKGVDDVDDVLKKLWKLKLIVVLQDQSGNEYYALQSDIKTLQYFPEYLLNMVRKQYQSKGKSNAVLLEYIEILKNQYSGLHKKSKGKRKVEEIA